MFKTYNFWIKLVAVLILIVRIVGDRLGFYVDSELYMDIATALASVLVILGVIQVPAVAGGDNKNKESVMREDVKETIKGMAEKLKGLTDNFNSAKLLRITAVMDEIISECESEVEIVKPGADIEKSAEEVSVQEDLQEVIIEEELSSEEAVAEGLEEYLLETEVIETLVGSEEPGAEETDIQSSLEGSEKEEEEKIIARIKTKIRALVESNLDELIAESLN